VRLQPDVNIKTVAGNADVPYHLDMARAPKPQKARMKTRDQEWNLAVARRLKALRAELGPQLTVGEFARIFSVSWSNMNNWINGIHLPPIWAGRRIAERADISLDWLYLGNGSGMPHVKSIRLHLLTEGEVPVGSEGDTDLVARVEELRKGLAKKAPGPRRRRRAPVGADE
jgi:hypothetical protein